MRGARLWALLRYNSPMSYRPSLNSPPAPGFWFAYAVAYAMLFAVIALSVGSIVVRKWQRTRPTPRPILSVARLDSKSI